MLSHRTHGNLQTQQNHEGINMRITSWPRSKHCHLIRTEKAEKQATKEKVESRLMDT